MPIILMTEDTEKVSKTKIPIPKKAKEQFKAMAKMYSDYTDKLPGGRVLKRLASDRKFDTKDTKGNGKEESEDYITVNNAKVIQHRQSQYAPDTVEYNLYGGKVGQDLMRDGIRRSRSVEKVPQVQPPKPTAAPKPKQNLKLEKI